MKTYLQLAVFFVVSVVLHLVFILGTLPSCSGGTPPGGAQAVAEALEIQAPVKIQMLEEVPPDEPEEPLRLSSNQEEGEEAPVSSPEPLPEPDPVPPEPVVPEPEPAPPVPEEMPPAVEVSAEPEEAPAEPERVVESAQALQKEVEKLSSKQKTQVQTRLSASDYRRYLKRMNLGKVKGMPTPELLLAYRDVAEMMEVHRYYGMKVLALDPAHAQSVVEVVGFGSPEVSWQKIDGFSWKSYSNRIFQRTSPYFSNLKRRMAADGVIGSGHILCSVSPSSVDSYFRYKQLENIKRAGFSKDQVGSVLARFRKTSFGGWMLETTQLHLKDGRLVDVQDFELEDLR